MAIAKKNEFSLLLLKIKIISLDLMKSMWKLIPLPELQHNILLSYQALLPKILKCPKFHEKSPGFNNIIKVLNSK